MPRINKSHRDLIDELSAYCRDADGGDWRTEHSKGYAALARRIGTGRENVSRWAASDRVPPWWWDRLEKISPKIKPGAFSRATFQAR